MFDQLKKWLSGDATWQDEQKLNQAASKDDFLSDALEGYRSVPEGDHTKAVKNLKTRLPGQSSNKKGGFAFQRIAAAAAIVLAVGAFFWLQRDISNTGELADANTPEKIIESPAASAPEVEKTVEEMAEVPSEILKSERVNETDDQLSEPLAYEEPKSDRNEIIVDPSNIEAGIIEEADLIETEEGALIADAVPTATTTLDPIADTLADVSIASNDVPAKVLEKEASVAYSKNDVEVAPATAPPPVVADARMSDDAAVKKEKSTDVDEQKSRSQEGVSVRKMPNTSRYANALSGKVVEASTNEGLIGASVFIKDTGEGVSTDFDGNYTLRSNKALPWTVVVAYTGFDNQEFLVNSLDDVYVVAMEEGGMMLEEIAVTGFSSRKKRQRSKDKAKSPQPKSSFKKLKKYIKKKMNYPEGAKQNSIEGEVTVQFYINAEGQPEEFVILKSLGHGCDEEAIRLLKEGPKWEPANRYTSYPVEFKL